MSTGFSAQRAVPHELFLARVQGVLYERGYEPVLLDVSGDDPDLSINDGAAFVDTKTRADHQTHYAVKHGALESYLRLTAQITPVYVVWDTWHVDSIFTLTARISGGPRRPTGNGSLTDWVLVKPGGTPFNEFFPSVWAT